MKKATDDNDGLQIDMMLERADRVIHIFEIKFYNKEFSITKDYAEHLRKRQCLFLQLSNTRKHVSLTFITSFGLKMNDHSLSVVEQDLTLEDLFS